MALRFRIVIWVNYYVLQLSRYVVHFYRRSYHQMIKKYIYEDKKYRTATHYLLRDGTGAGFFSLFLQALGAMEISRRTQSQLSIQFTHGYYLDPARGPNWWEYYFETGHFSFNQQRLDNRTVVIEDTKEKLALGFLAGMLPYRKANQLCSVIRLRPELAQEIAAFVEENFKNRYVVGIHYRGTDKVTGPRAESQRLPYAYVAALMERGFPRSTYFFLATDEGACVDFMKERFNERIILYDSYRSRDGTPVHKSSKVAPAFKLGADALVECMLLSKCRIVLRTQSALSMVSQYFNPQLRTLNLTRLYASARYLDHFIKNPLRKLSG